MLEDQNKELQQKVDTLEKKTFSLSIENHNLFNNNNLSVIF